MRTTIWDRIAAKFGYVREAAQPCACENVSTAVMPPIIPAPIVPTPRYFGLPDDVKFEVQRGDRIGCQHMRFADVLDFLHACGDDLRPQGVTLGMIVAGESFEIHGAVMSFRVAGQARKFG